MKAKDVWEAWEDAMRANRHNFEDSFWSLLDFLEQVMEHDADDALARDGAALMEECKKRLLDWIDRNDLTGPFQVSLDNDKDLYAADADVKPKRPRQYRTIDDK